MVFNWFRRQFNDSSATPQEQEQLTPAPVEPKAEPAQEVASSQEPSQNVAEDYLSWAKAAYKNIQQEQQSQPVQKAADEPTELSQQPAQTAEIETTDTAMPKASNAYAASTQPPTVAEIEAHHDQIQQFTEDAASEPSATTTDTLPKVELSVTEPAADEKAGTVTDEQPAETAPLPFWARAEADRQARLERLKATAIEVPEPEVVPTAAALAEPTEANLESLAPKEVPGLAFDEGFLWSASILSAQGRRPEDVSVEEITWLKKLRQGLDKTRRNIVNQLKAIVGQGPLNQAAVMEIEALLLQADVGVEATDYIINALQDRLKQEALPPDAAIAYLKQILRDMLDRPLQSHNPIFAPEKDTLNIWLITGVNGAGKTTTIGKIAHIAQKSGYKCLIGAADTFRAAAVEQVKIWGSRSGIEVIANPGQNTDPAAVVFDAIAAAGRRGTELLLVDTAGRLQNKKNLMEELSKIRRIIDKKAANAKVESLLVLDATLGQNGLRQAEVFAQAAQLSGVVLTKLDGTAKGGVALAVVQQLGLPIRFIGAGEGIEDLRPFSSYEFVEALLSS